jgi:ribosome recycling factor
VIDETLFEAEEKMEKAVTVAKDDFAASAPAGPPGMFNKIVVDYYGAPTPVTQMASFHVPEARMVVISRTTRARWRDREGHPRLRPRRQPDQRRLVIRVSFPQLTEERRRDLIKPRTRRAARARTPRCRSATSGASAKEYELTSSRSKDGDAGEDDVARPRREGARGRGGHRTSTSSVAAASTTGSSTRKPSCSRSETPAGTPSACSRAGTRWRRRSAPRSPGRASPGR